MKLTARMFRGSMVFNTVVLILPCGASLLQRLVFVFIAVVFIHLALRREPSPAPLKHGSTRLYRAQTIAGVKTRFATQYRLGALPVFFLCMLWSLVWHFCMGRECVCHRGGGEPHRTLAPELVLVPRVHSSGHTNSCPRS